MRETAECEERHVREACACSSMPYWPIDPSEYHGLLRLLTSSPQFSRDDPDVVLALFHLRRECAIVNSMTPEQLQDPGRDLEERQLRELAQASKTTTVEVRYLIERHRAGEVSSRYTKAQNGWRVTELCPPTHQELVNHMCPWCGRPFYEGRPRW